MTELRRGLNQPYSRRGRGKRALEGRGIIIITTIITIIIILIIITIFIIIILLIIITIIIILIIIIITIITIIITIIVGNLGLPEPQPTRIVLSYKCIMQVFWSLLDESIGFKKR